MTGRPVFQSDLDRILEPGREAWERLRNSRIFLTGGTGFVGKWLLSAFLHARERLGLEAEILVLTRQPERFLREAPHLASAPGIQLIQGDVVRFAFPPQRCSHVLHAAAQVQDGAAGAQRTGLERILQLVERHGAGRLLYVSSGAVYGRQPAERLSLPEDTPLGEALNEYGRGKQLCEELLRQAGGLSYTVARCFAFLGPYLPAGAGYAAADFLNEAARGQNVTVAGDGSPVRSYLYAADLALWLWTLLARGGSGTVYNVGAETPVRVGELAREIARQAGVEVEIQGQAASGNGGGRYIPCTHKARTELGLEEHWSLSEAVAATLRWLTGEWRV